MHPSDLTEAGEDPEDGTALLLDRDLQNVNMEIQMLHDEGRHREAKLLTRRLREQRAERLRLRLRQAKELTAAGMRQVVLLLSPITYPCPYPSALPLPLPPR